MEHEEKWVGAVALPYPSGVHELSGTCVGAGTSGDEVCRISIHVLRDEQSHIRTLLATRELRYLDGSLVGGDRPLQLVTDAIEPEALDDAKVEVAVGTCQRDGRDDSRILAALEPAGRGMVHALPRPVAAGRGRALRGAGSGQGALPQRLRLRRLTAARPDPR